MSLRGLLTILSTNTCLWRFPLRIIGNNGGCVLTEAASRKHLKLEARGPAAYLRCSWGEPRWRLRSRSGKRVKLCCGETWGVAQARWKPAVATSGRRRRAQVGGILAHSNLQNFIHSATFEGFRAWKVCLRSCHSISVGFKSVLWFGPSKNLNFVFLEPFRGGLAGVFEIIVLLHEPNALGVTNWRPDILLQDFLIECRIQGSINYGKSSRSWSCKAAPDHHTTITMFYCWCDVLFKKCCVGFMPDVTTSKK